MRFRLLVVLLLIAALTTGVTLAWTQCQASFGTK